MSCWGTTKARVKDRIRDFIGIYRSGHHDYVIRGGKVIPNDNIVGQSNLTRFTVMAPVWDDAVAGRRVLDIGANLGFFSLKALEHGASHVTSLELLPELWKRLRRIRSRHRRWIGDRWTIKPGDFFDDLVECDTVFMFGITYHMVRHGMNRKVLPEEGAYRELFARISKLATHGVLAEWGPPKRPSFEPSPYWDQFSYERFCQALAEFFPYDRYLGRHEYYGAGREDPVRHVHYATKVPPGIEAGGPGRNGR